jgi:RNA polymerase sigma-70 factor, ECF subfamily
MSAQGTVRDEPFIQFDEDTHLMLKVTNGDQQAYGRLYEKYVPIVRRYFTRHNGRSASPEDLAQEVFTRIWRHRGQYRPLAPVRSYLLGVAANVSRESRAKARGKSPIDACDPETLDDTSRPPPPAQAQSAEQLQVVKTLMSSLTDRQRQAVELVYLAGLSPVEAAKRIGCSVRALQVHLCLARRKLRGLAHPSE